VRNQIRGYIIGGYFLFNIANIVTNKGETSSLLEYFSQQQRKKQKSTVRRTVLF
jgi:hypothetical protein